MTKVLATGTVSNLSFESPEGKTYKLANLSVGGKEFKGIFKRPQGLVEGMMVEVVENPAAPGRKYPEKEIRLAAGVPQPAAAIQPTRGFGRDPAEQDKISRQWAITQAINFLNIARESGAVTKTALSSEVTLQQLVGRYANFYFNAVQTGAGFEKMPQFTGEINEASEDAANG
jgi:hypothetical protein